MIAWGAGTPPDALRRPRGGDLGALMGLSEDWACNIIKQVGNYGEIYDANLDPDTPINLARGRNSLVRDGGLMFAPPVR